MTQLPSLVQAQMSLPQHLTIHTSRTSRNRAKRNMSEVANTEFIGAIADQ